MFPNRITNRISNRSLIFISLIVFASIYFWTTRRNDMTFDNIKTLDKDIKNEDKEPAEIKLNDADLPMSYGGYGRPAYDDLSLIEVLPKNFVPTLENKRRLVILGDIHGMDTSLEEILHKVSFDTAKDHLIAVGDMVNKGPNSSGVIARLMKLKASAVRGNHEDRVLLARAELDSLSGVSKELETSDFQDQRGEMRDIHTARSLTKAQLDWISKLPVILTVDDLNLLICHAGLVPGLDIEKQDPWAVMNMRTLVYPREEIRKDEGEEPRNSGVEEGHAPRSSHDDASLGVKKLSLTDHPSDEDEDLDTSPIPFDRAVAVPVSSRGGRRWYEAWTAQQKRLKKHDRKTVVYGHDAKTGYKESKYTFGLDSGCSKGGALTALVVEAKKGGGFKQMMYQTTCRDTKS